MRNFPDTLKLLSLPTCDSNIIALLTREVAE